MKRYWLCIFLAIFLFPLKTVARAQVEEQIAASEKAPSRPNPEAGPTQVLVSLWLADIDSINSAQQSFTVNVYIELEWKDPRLAHGGKGFRRYNALEIWTPRIQIANEIGIVRKTMADFVDVAGDGTAIRRQRYVGPLSQKMNLRDFPFDKHLFRIHFVSTGNKPGEVHFSPNPRHTNKGLKGAAGISPDISLPDFVVEGYEVRPLAYTFTETLETAGYAFEFTAKRDVGYFVLKVILPLILIVMMSWVAFWIDPKETGTNITAVMTSMLTLVAYRFTFENYIPKVGYLTRIDKFMLWSTLMVFCSMMQVVLNAALVARGKHTAAVWIDRMSRVVYPVVFVFITLKSLML
jgi:hypothetical protein